MNDKLVMRKVDRERKPGKNKVHPARFKALRRKCYE